MIKDKLTWSLTVMAFSALGVTARYLHELGKNNGAFSFKRYLAEVIIGVILSISMGMICYSVGMSNPMVYGLVSIFAISSKELMNALPTIVVRLVKRNSEKLDFKRKRKDDAPVKIPATVYIMLFCLILIALVIVGGFLFLALNK